MLFSLLAIIAASLETGWTSLKTGLDALVVEPSGLVIPEEPTTFKLAFAGAITLSVYALITGYRRRRRDIGLGMDRQAREAASQATKTIQREAA